MQVVLPKANMVGIGANFVYFSDCKEANSESRISLVMCGSYYNN